MTKLIDAIQSKDSRTENGMVTNSSTHDVCLDLFYKIGSMRGKDKGLLINAFTKAFGENPLTAMKILFWVRDIRGGSGERKIFRDIVTYLAENRTDILAKNINLIPEFGRWDDLLVLLDSKVSSQVLELIKGSIYDKKSLCAKWMPRPNGSVKNKLNAAVIRKYLGLTPKEYRKLLVANSNTVEQLMCAKEFDKIDYSKLPSKAMSDLMKTFSRNDLARFQEYLASVEKGTAKINAGAVYPYDILKNLKSGNNQGANAQWLALPDYMGENTERVLPLVDVSGSMCCSAGGSPSITCMDVAISLGLYISERNVGPFKDAFITFHTNPQLLVVKGSLSERYEQMARSPWGGSTNLEAAYQLILSKAVNNNVPQSEMPTMMLILSDMEFNQATRWSDTAQEMIERKFADAGYEMPKVVYWNLNSRNEKNSPVTKDKENAFLVSGFSPSLLVSVLSGKSTTPLEMMLEVVYSERYASVTI